MTEKIFLAGATGAVGRALVPLLIEAGYEVHGSTRRPERAAALQAMGAKPVLVDVFDAQALKDTLVRIAPTGVIHQLTDLPPGLDPARMAESLVRNARVRTEGTRHLVDAARAAGAKRIIAQSIAWAYAPAPGPFTEDLPLDVDAEGARGVSVRGVAALEQAVLNAEGMTGTVLRYGRFYGPGTGFEVPAGPGPVHVEAAAWAALLAWQHSIGGVFNVAEDGPEVDSGKVRRVLGWRPEMRVATTG